MSDVILSLAVDIHRDGRVAMRSAGTVTSDVMAFLEAVFNLKVAYEAHHVIYTGASTGTASATDMEEK